MAFKVGGDAVGDHLLQGGDDMPGVAHVEVLADDGRLAALCPVKGDLTGALSELIIRYNTPLVTLAVPEGCALPEAELSRVRRAAELLGARLLIEMN